MPKYFCDYCDTFLTHDSPSVRKTHNGGRKHKENVRLYYQQWMEEQAQKLVDATTKAFQEGKIQSTPSAMPAGYNPRGGPGGAMIPPPQSLAGGGGAAAAAVRNMLPPPRPGMPPLPIPAGMPMMPVMRPGMPMMMPRPPVGMPGGMHR